MAHDLGDESGFGTPDSAFEGRAGKDVEPDFDLVQLFGSTIWFNFGSTIWFNQEE